MTDSEIVSKIKQLVPDCRKCTKSGRYDEEDEMICGQCMSLAMREIRGLLFCDDEIPFS